ncbi:hypothetical protein ACWCXC_35090 [Streptomyces sp. NPDC001515]
MRQLRVWADLSYRQIERNATQAGDVLPRATISGALARTDLPREELLAAFVRACGGDTATVDTWLTARRELAITAAPTAAPPRPPLPRPQELSPDDAPPQDAVPPEDGAVTAQAGSEPAGSSPTTVPTAPPSMTIEQPSEPPSTTAPTPPPSSYDRDTRPRYLPMTLTGALAAAGVLLIALWPGGDKPVSTQPGNTPSPGISVSTAPPSASGPTATSPTPTADPVGAGSEETSDAPTTRPTTQRSTSSPPSPRKTPVPARTPPTGVVRIHPLDDPSLCLTEGRERNGRTEREIAVQNPCAQAIVPTVSLVPAGARTYLIQWEHPDHGGGCLTVDGASTGPGALLSPRDCIDAAHQKYRLEAVTGGFRLRPSHSDLCVGILTPRTTGAEAIQQTCTGTDDQTFRITTV